MQAFVSQFLRTPILKSIPVPIPEPAEILIKVSYVSLNPTDYKHAAIALPPSKVIGCDFSGVVTSLGSAVDINSFSSGDRVAGIVHGCHYSHTGAFAEFLVADPNLCFHIPDQISLSQACTLGVGWISASQALRQRLYKDVRNTSNKQDALLVYSAATNMGMHTIQQARLEHPDTCIIALASPQHHSQLRKYGANEVFDYRSPSVVADVQKLGKKILRGIDCHSEGDSTVLTAEYMLASDELEAKTFGVSEQRRIVRTLPPSLIRGKVPSGVRADEWILSYTALGKPFWFLFRYYPASTEDYENASKYLKSLTELLEEGRVIPVKHRLMPGGLGNIGDGFAEMKAGRVRGEKLVYRVAGEVKDALAKTGI